MASLFNRITRFASSPQGQRAIRQASGKAQQWAKDPKNKARIDDVRRRLPGGNRTQGREDGGAPSRR